LGILLEAEIESISEVQEWKTFVEIQTGQKVKILRSDNGSEYISKEFKDYLARKGIKHQLSISGRPEQNRVTKRMNRTLVECDCSIRLQADMSEEF